MANVTITVPEELRREMKKRKKTNWSSVARKAFEEALREEEMTMAAEGIDKLRTSGKTPSWNGAKEIRKWRDAIDSSVAVKWFSDEETTPQAVELRDSHVKGELLLITTPLLTCELANALRYKPDYDKDRLVEAMNYFYKLHLYEVPIDAHLLSRSSEIAFKGNVTIYDAIPVALAVLKRTECLTADRDTQYARLKPKGYPIDLLRP
jgi:predicted nucleic acid-binding protein